MCPRRRLISGGDRPSGEAAFVARLEGGRFAVGGVEATAGIPAGTGRCAVRRLAGSPAAEQIVEAFALKADVHHSSTRPTTPA
ncbi:hypothetical protein BWI15_25015 [Kribbella sp. ALI-6-A]|nr:hypothetical protein BWI15_25015 [Kribbella sp. ALI-6-A]